MSIKVTSSMFNRSCVEIDLGALKNNISEIRRITSKNAQIMAVVKADAYGHGAVTVAKTLLENGADQLCVATIDEAIELRKANINSNILILGYTDPTRFADVVSYSIDQAVYDFDTAKALSDEAIKNNKKVNIHVKIDSGMGRIGIKPGPDSTQDIDRICALEGLIPYGIFSHFAVADENDDEYTLQQFDCFMKQVEALNDKGIHFTLRHICNSAGLMRFPQMHLDMVRAGIILYGLMPKGCPKGYTAINLIPVMSWCAKIIYSKQVDPGTSVSYGRHFISARKTNVLTVSVGYADGLSRRFSNDFSLLVEGEKVPIIGNICMDMCMLDGTDMKTKAHVESLVEVFGKDRPADELADYLGTINYEITCVVGKRVQRIFADENGIVQ
ncbi:MAG TPA: alanine racemase [Saccharofermentans sp.]|nr:alanine racemase [Clostridia bacterium]NLX68416.1 alanine racemase [Clostridiaceae bacterium]HOO48801.1 alanine racemase [Saccharofermentans sp.]HPE27574.1 alanine racemase [Saccharofermentans sp.]HPJ80998.1 alanine racemase [Saccharofermentans sp.]